MCALRRPAPGLPDSQSDPGTGRSTTASLSAARCRLARRSFSLALLVAVPGLLVALDLTACARYPGQQDRNGTLAALCLCCVITAGRTIGVWAGLVCCHWSPIGAFVFGVAQVSAAGIGVAAIAEPRDWTAVARLFTAESAVALTGALAVLVVALLAGCYATRRAAPSDQ
jgi:hypothetical protein